MIRAARGRGVHLGSDLAGQVVRADSLAHIDSPNAHNYTDDEQNYD